MNDMNSENRGVCDPISIWPFFYVFMRFFLQYVVFFLIPRANFSTVFYKKYESRFNTYPDQRSPIPNQRTFHSVCIYYYFRGAESLNADNMQSYLINNSERFNQCLYFSLWD